jgi:hypothetical protein
LTLATANSIDFSIKVGVINNIASKKLDEKFYFNDFLKFLDLKISEAISLFDIIGDKNNDEKLKEIQRQRINEFISSLNFIQTMLNWFYSSMSKSVQPLDSKILMIFQKVL